MLWFSLSLLLLSIIPEKKPRYLLPLLIPGAINIALYLYHCLEGFPQKAERLIFRINGTVIALLLLVLPAGLFFLFGEEKTSYIWSITIASLLFWILCAIIIYSLYGRKKRIAAEPVIASIAAAMIVVEVFCIVPIGHLFVNNNRKSIRVLRDNPQTNNLPFYHSAKEELRIEFVYESNKIIRPIDVNDQERFFDALPLVYIGDDNIFSSLPVTVEVIGIFDNNWQKPGNKRYNKDLVRKASIIRLKK